MKQVVAIILTAALVTTGCASAGRAVVATGPAPNGTEMRAMADYVQKLAAGSRVRVERTDGHVLHGTLMAASGEKIVVQQNTRIPEPPIDVPIARLARVTPETSGTSTGKAVAIGIASGVGAFFAILAIAFAAGGD